MSMARVRAVKRLRRLFTHTAMAFHVYRYRYLALFTAIGLLSILLELAFLQWVIPTEWPFLVRAIAAFGAGLVASFSLNANVNFRVPKAYFWGTFLRFSVVSALSFAINCAALQFFSQWIDWGYGPLRLACSGVLFLAAYMVHRRLTFKSARNFGVAVYASSQERVYRIFHKVGRACDHIHIDLVDETVNPQAAPVDLGRISLARRLWPGVSFAMHIMSRRPSKWLHQTEGLIDWYLFHINAEEDLFQHFAWCQSRGKKIGVVWHQTDRIEDLYQYLPHVDFVMVLGIAQPGRSGQSISEAALKVTETLRDLSGRYGYRVMFDGSVNPQTIHRIHAQYVVAASAVLNANVPVHAIYQLKRGVGDERWAA